MYDGTNPGFISYTIDNSNKTYPTLTLSLHKYNTGLGYSTDEIQSLICNLEISGTYKDAKDKLISVPATNIKFSVNQSVAYATTIDGCEPYNLNTEDDESIHDTVVNALNDRLNSSDYSSDEWKCDWYLVDSSNQYYQIKSNIIEKLAEVNKSNTLVGIAKRVN